MLGFEKLFNKSQKENPKDEEEHNTSVEDNQHEFNKVMEEKEEGTPENIMDKEQE